MSRPSLATLGSRLLAFAVVGMVGLGSVGCSGGSGSSSAADGSSKPRRGEDMTAPDAWKKLEADAKTSKITGMINTVVGGPKWSALFADSTAEAERNLASAMDGALPKRAIDAMVDDLAQSVIQQLSSIPEVEASPTQFYLAFGKIDAGDNGAAEAAVEDLIAKLSENTAVTDRFFVVSSPQTEANDAIKQIAGGDLSSFRHPLGKTPDTTKARELDPKLLYLVTGRVIDSKDVPQRSIDITMRLNVQKPQTRQDVSRLIITKKYMWHPYRKDWELQN
jgi:hypothetical protein